MSSNDKGKSGISNKNKLKEVKSAKQSDKLPDVEKQHPEKTETGKFKSTPIIFYIILIVIPVLFFVLLESSLRLFHYGIDTRQWVQVTQNKLMLNSDIAHRYFYSINNVPYSNQDVFDKVKAKKFFPCICTWRKQRRGLSLYACGCLFGFLEKKTRNSLPGIQNRGSKP